MRVAVLDDYQKVAAGFGDWKRLAGRVELRFFHDHVADQGALVERLKPFEILAIMRERTPFPADLLERLPNLRLLVTTGMRNDAVDVGAAERLGITVCGTRSPGHATAELAFALILALARNLPAETASMQARGWQVRIGRDLRGATLGILGLGRLGSLVAGFARAFGMEVVAWSQNLSEERAAEVGARRVDKHELFRAADFITIHLRLSERTVGLVGREELGRMKPDAYLVNTSRGPIVDEQALIEALEGGRIAGAALDVYDIEPLPADHRLTRAPNVLLTPHIGYVTRETYEAFYGGTVEAIAAWLDGRPINVIQA